MANRWVDRTHPQTLYIATIFLYINAAFSLLGLIGIGASIFELFYLLYTAALVASGLGIANDKKLAYYLAIVVAVVPIAGLFLGIFGGGIINLIFEIALVVLLLHPRTREYVRLWFR